MWCLCVLLGQIAGRIFINIRILGRPIGRLGRDQSHLGDRSSSIIGRFSFDKTNPKKARSDKYAKKTSHIRNYVQHARWQFHRLLEQLINDPYTPNHLDRIADGHPQLRDALRKAGVAGLTRDELLEKRDDYVARLKAGE